MFKNEKVVETKVCKHCKKNFDITDKDLEFLEKISPVFSSPSPSDIPLNLGGTKGGVIKLENGKIKYLIPPPSFCPECRRQRRLSFRNERNLYKRKCDFSGKDIISIYSPDKNFKVYDQDIRWSDKWDGIDYGPENGIDFSRSFFKQFEELLKDVPELSLYQLNNYNSPYINAASQCKNCYMIFNSDFCEDSLYSYSIRNCKKCIDCSYTNTSENCYECLECGSSYNLLFSIKSSRSRNSYFLYNCINCENCFLSSNLDGKKYYIFNKKYSPEEYEKKKLELLSKGIPFLKKEFKRLIEKSFTKYMLGYSNENSSGDTIFYTKNSKNIYDCEHVEDCKNCDYLIHTKNCLDYQIFGDYSENIYESMAVGDHCNTIAFSLYCWSGASNLFYCYGLGNNCHNCFGCVGLKNKSYCIFNKEYTREKYEKLVPKIISHMMKTGEWGEFFPSSMSLLGYNESVTSEQYPLTREEVVSPDSEKESGLKMGKIFNWSDYEAPFPKVAKIIPASKLPDDISKIPDDILNWAIEDEERKTRGLNPLFRIIKEELEFYRKHNLPIPRKHPDDRHKQRISLRLPRKLYTRTCDKCKKEIESIYPQENKEKVYCEDCYNKEMY